MCHHYRTYHHLDERDAEPVATRSPAGPVRIGDAERERTAELLRAHAAAGRLDPSELEERLERTYSAKYAADLDGVLAELPPESAPRSTSRPDASIPLLPVALVALFVLAAINGNWGLLWLAFPIVFLFGRARWHHHQRSARV